MCGRFTSNRSDRDVADALGVQYTTDAAAELGPSWNVAPTQTIRAVRERTTDDSTHLRELGALRWGLVPSWASDPNSAYKMINARAETVTTRPAFRAAAARRRCLIPADGYIEWQRSSPSTAKQPWYLHAPNGELLAFAAIYEGWRNPDVADGDPHQWLWSVAVLTTTASDALGHVHDRSPVVLPHELHDPWLDPQRTDRSDVDELLSHVPEPRLTPYRISTAINSPRNNDPSLLQAQADAESTTE